MGLLDKAKQQAAQLAQKGQDAAQKGQEKLQNVQAKRQADALLRDLGAAVFAERTGRGDETTVAEIERLVTALTEHEEAHGAVDLGSTADDPPGEAPGGTYSIDEL